MFKSGTTLLRAMLGQHPALFSGLETYWFNVNIEDDYFEKHTLPKLAFFLDLNYDRIISLYRSATCAEGFLENIMSLKANEELRSGWIEKTPGNCVNLDRILSYWVDARVIVIERDPRDVFSSFMQAKKWDSIPEFFKIWNTMVSDVSDCPQVKYVRYEDLILDPEKTMKDICDHVRLEYCQEISVFSGKKTDFDKVLKQTGKTSSTLERLKNPLTNSRIGIWRNCLDNAVILELEKVADSYGNLNRFRSLYWPVQDNL